MAVPIQKLYMSATLMVAFCAFIGTVQQLFLRVVFRMYHL